MFEQSLPISTMIENINYHVVEPVKKKELLKNVCFHIGKNMNNANPLSLQFSPTNFSISSSDSIILPVSFLDEFDIVPSIVFLTAIYYCVRMNNAYTSNKEDKKTLEKVESVLSMSNDYDQNLHNLRRLVIGTSLSFISAKILSTFYVNNNLTKEEIRKIEKDTILKSYLKRILESYSIYHKKA